MAGEPAPPKGVTRERSLVDADDAVGVSLPVGFRATRTDESFTLTVRSRPPWAWFLALFALFWNGFMAVWFGIALTTGEWGMALFGTLHGAVGVAVGYTALRLLFNRRELDVAGGVLTVRHRPFPWLAPPPIAKRDLDQLYVELDRSLEVNDEPVDRYALKADTLDGEVHTLLVCEDREQAEYLEVEIERAYAIVDRPVPGALRKRKKRRT